jgi:RHS repeat-associated protein
MKKEVIFLIFLVVCIPFSYAKVVDVPEVKDSEDLGEPLRDETGVKKFVYAGSSIIASIEDSEIKYYHKDRLNNRMTSDINGNKNGEFLSLPFGQKIENSGIDYPFTGKEEDESSLYYFGARYYDSNLGKFTSVDPVKDNHPYSYVANNPMNLVDPDGRNYDIVPGERDVQTAALNVGIGAAFAFGAGVVRGDDWSDIWRNTLVGAGVGLGSFALRSATGRANNDIEYFTYGLGQDFLASVQSNAIQNKGYLDELHFEYLFFNLEFSGSDFEGVGVDLSKAGHIVSFAFMEGNTLNLGRTLGTGNFIFDRDHVFSRGGDRHNGMYGCGAITYNTERSGAETTFRHENIHGLEDRYWTGVGRGVGESLGINWNPSFFGVKFYGLERWYGKGFEYAPYLLSGQDYGSSEFTFWETEAVTLAR